MAYPTLKSLHRRLLREGKKDELIDLLEKFNSTKELDDALNNFETYVNWSTSQLIVRQFNEWVSEGRQPGALREKLMYMKEQYIDVAIFFIEGALDRSKGPQGVANRCDAVFDAIPTLQLRLFAEYVNKNHQEYHSIISSWLSNHTCIVAVMQLTARDMKFAKADEEFKKFWDEFSKIPYIQHSETFQLAKKIVSMLSQLPHEECVNTLERGDLFGIQTSPFIPTLIHATQTFVSGDVHGAEKILTVGIENFPEDIRYDLMYDLRIVRHRLEKVTSDLKAINEPHFRKFLKGLERLRQPLKNIRREDYAEAFEDIDIQDGKSGAWLIPLIAQYLVAGKPGSIFDNDSDNLNRRTALYGAFSQLPELEQDRYIDTMVDLAVRWHEKQQEKDAADRKKWPPEAPEGAPDAVFDDYAFADQRRDTPSEQNNPEEDDMYNLLYKHFTEGLKIPLDDAETIRNILVKGYYKNVFSEPTEAHIYRGMVVTQDWLAAALKQNLEDIPSKGEKGADFDFTPRDNGVSSWTTEPEMARGFTTDAANRFSDKIEYGVVLVAKTSDNDKRFLEGEGGLYNVQGFDKHKDEKECVALGRIKVSKMFWSEGQSVRRNDMGVHGSAEKKTQEH